MSAYAPARLSPVLTGDACDPIDRLMLFTGGDILRVSGDGGEYDDLTAGLISTRDRRRLAGARLTGTSCGMPADVLHEVVAEMYPPVRSLSPAEFVGWYFDECLDGLSYRASARAGTVWHEQERPDDEDEGSDVLETGTVSPVAPVAPSETHTGTVPAWATDWVGRLVHPPKRALLLALIGHRWHGATRPTIPADEWAMKLADKFDRKAGK